MKWMRERDLLIAQTLAFVESVTGKLPASDKTTAMPAAVTAAATSPVAATPPVETPKSIRITPPLADEAHPPADEIPPVVEMSPSLVEQVLPLPLPVEPALPIEEALPVVAQDEPTPSPVIAAVSPIDLRVDFQSEIRARVASFRAHQERFSREREAYCSTTMAKVHASIREIGSPTSGK